MSKTRCRHSNHSWLIAGGYVEWCYRCGAWRRMRKLPGINGFAPDGKWRRPTGPNGKNPAMTTCNGGTV